MALPVGEFGLVSGSKIIGVLLFYFLVGHLFANALKNGYISRCLVYPCEVRTLIRTNCAFPLNRKQDFIYNLRLGETYSVNLVEGLPPFLRSWDLRHRLNGPFQPRSPNPQTADVLLLDVTGQSVSEHLPSFGELGVPSYPAFEIVGALAVL